jgi:hypothetical protein
MKSKDLQKEGVMNFKNVGRVTIFVFVLGFVFMSLGWSQTWNIPDYIKLKYPDSHPQKIDIEDLKKGLEFKVEQIEKAVNRLFDGSSQGNRKFDAIGEILVGYGAVINHETSNPFSDVEAISNFFKGHNSFDRVDLELDEVTLFAPGKMVDDVDILAIVELNFTFSNVNNQEKLDPPGVITLYHRKICTWR